jgi:diguanylate cyclase (GGDEF)-like protein
VDGPQFEVPTDLSAYPVLGRGAQSVVYRVPWHGRDWALKVFQRRDPEARRTIRREAALLAWVAHPLMARVHEVGLVGDQPYLVMDLVDGQSLAERLKSVALPVVETIRLGIEVAQTLAAAHGVRLVHRDIKPQNIMLDSAGRARLIDFGLAVRPVGEDAGRADQAAGTLLYCPPEQSGLLHRPVDGRSDLYALGAVLFECLTGRPPFDAEDPGELLRQHATEPVPDIKDAPEWLARVVTKLLAKDPDDRYQSCAGLIVDLEQHSDTPGRHDGVVLPGDRHPLVGRDDEVAQLVDRWTAARHARGSVALVHGAPGTGRSRLVREVAAKVRDEGGAVFAVTCAEDAVPLSHLRAALPVDLPLDLDVRILCDRVAEHLRATGGALLCFDDAHHLDETSRAVLARLVLRLPDVPVLVLLTTPDSSPLPDGVLDAGTTAITLSELDRAQVQSLVDSLIGGRPGGAELVDRLAAGGGATPFAVREYLSVAFEAGILTPSWGRIIVDADGLDRMPLPGDLQGLLRDRLATLDPDTRELLTAAAVVGARFTQELAMRAAGRDDEHAATRGLSEALRHGVLTFRENHYRFVHDSTRDALLTGADVRDLHERLSALQITEFDDPYAPARHALHGFPDRAPASTVEKCLAAGKRALGDRAPATAIGFLEPAVRWAPPGTAVWRDAQEALGLAYQLVCRFDAAIAALKAALAGTTGPTDRARILWHITLVQRYTWQTVATDQTVREGLAALGRPLPVHFGRLVGGSVGRLLAGLIRGRLASARIWRGPNDPAERERLALQTRLCENGSLAALFGLNQPLSAALTFRALDASSRLGISPEYVRVQAALAQMAHAIGLPWARLSRDRALRLADRLGDPDLVAATTWMIDMMAHITGRADVRRTVHDLLTGTEVLEAGDFGAAAGGAALRLVAGGYARAALELIEACHARLAAEGRLDPSIAMCEATALAALGRFVEAEALLRRDDVAAAAHDPGVRVNLLGTTAHVALEQRELAVFARAAAEFAALGVRPNQLLPGQQIVYQHLAYGRLEQRSVEDAERALHEWRPVARAAQIKPHYLVAAASLRQLRGDHAGALKALAKAEPTIRDTRIVLASYEAGRVRARALAALGHPAESTAEAARARSLAEQHGWGHRADWVTTEFGLDRRRGSALSSVSGTRNVQHRLGALEKVSRAAARVLDPAELTRVCLDQIIEALSAERAYLFLAEPNGALTPHLGRDSSGADLSELTGYGSTLVERVRVTHEPLVVTGTDEGAALGSQSAVIHGLRSILVAPLLLDRRLLGVVYLDSRVAKGIFTDSDTGLLSAITTHVAAALETARAAQLAVAVQSAEHERDVAERLRDAMRHISATLDPADVLRRLHTTLSTAVAAGWSWFVLADGDKFTLTHNDSRVLSELVDPATDPQLASLLQASDPVLGSGRGPATFDAPDLRSWLAIPLRARDTVVGIAFLGSTEPGAFSPAQVELGAALTGQAMTAYDNARLFAEVQQLASTDGLTGLFNRRHFFELAHREFAIADRQRVPLGAIMLDIDHFKQINDRYGHAAGDAVIAAVARRLVHTARRSDLVGRYGGEEFAILQIGDGDLAAFAERLRRAVGDAPIDTPAGPLTVTASVGVAVRTPDDADPSTLLSRADRALYRAKEAGRDRVAIADRQ